MNTLFFSVRAWIAARYEGDGERGATMVEYGLLVSLIAVAVILAATALGGGVADLFEEVTLSL